MVDYLARTGGQEAAAAILQTGLQPPNSVGKPTAAHSRQALQFRVHCLWALGELQAVQAVRLAAALWPDPDFRKEFLAQACHCLTQIKDPEVAQLLEGWLRDQQLTSEPSVLEPLLVSLKEWPERPVPERIEQLAEDGSVAPSVRALAWEVLVCRGGFQGVCRLRRHLAELAAAERLSEPQIEELTGIVQFIARYRLPLESEVTVLIPLCPGKNSVGLLDGLWGCLIILNAAHARLPSRREWFMETCLPVFRDRLVRGPHTRERPMEQWLDAFKGCPDDILAELGKVIQGAWPSLSGAVRLSVMRFYSDAPDHAPRDVVERSLTSADKELRQAAIDIVVATRPGRLVRKRTSDPEVDRSFARTSVAEGTLFFGDQYYSVSKCRYISYEKE